MYAAIGKALGMQAGMPCSAPVPDVQQAGFDLLLASGNGSDNGGKRPLVHVPLCTPLCMTI